MQSYVIAALAISVALATAYHFLQPAPELGITPEMFNWTPGWLGLAAFVLVSALIVALVIGMVIHFVRWLKGLRDLT